MNTCLNFWKICNQMSEQTGERVTADAMVMSGKVGVLPLHCNMQDICVLQIAGSKRWQLCGPPVVNPVKGMSRQPAPQNAPFFDEALCAGFLFIPAGCWHRCENGPGLSLHVGILFEPPCGRDVLISLVSRLAADDTFNQPLTRCRCECVGSARGRAKGLPRRSSTRVVTCGFPRRACRRALEGRRHLCPGSDPDGEGVSVAVGAEPFASVPGGLATIGGFVARD